MANGADEGAEDDPDEVHPETLIFALSATFFGSGSETLESSHCAGQAQAPKTGSVCPRCSDALRASNR